MRTFQSAKDGANAWIPAFWWRFPSLSNSVPRPEYSGGGFRQLGLYFQHYLQQLHTKAARPFRTNLRDGILPSDTRNLYGRRGCDGHSMGKLQNFRVKKCDNYDVRSTKFGSCWQLERFWVSNSKCSRILSQQRTIFVATLGEIFSFSPSAGFEK